MAAAQLCGQDFLVRLQLWGHARTRTVRDHGTRTLTLRPRRGRCPTCRSTHVLLPGLVAPRRADTTAVIGAALEASAAGSGYRRIAAALGRPVSAAPGQPDTAPPPMTGSAARWGAWPLLLIALGAFVSIWGVWVGLGEVTGFGPIALLPGIADHIVINSAITLPIGVEAYAAFALRTWLAPGDGLSEAAHQFARWSAIGRVEHPRSGSTACTRLRRRAAGQPMSHPLTIAPEARTCNPIARQGDSCWSST